MEFKQAILEPHIAIIKTEDELDAFIDRAGVALENIDWTRKMFHARKSLTVTNSRTGEYCVAYKYIPSLTEQAI